MPNTVLAHYAEPNWTPRKVAETFAKEYGNRKVAFCEHKLDVGTLGTRFGFVNGTRTFFIAWIGSVERVNEGGFEVFINEGVTS